MSILINDGNLQDRDVIRCDIGEFVLTVERLKEIAEPFVRTSSYCLSVIRWESPLRSLFWMCVISVVSLINPVYLLITALLPVPPLLCVEWLRTCGKRRVPQSRYKDFFERKDDDVHEKLKATQDKWRSDLKTYLDILVAMQRVFYQIINHFEYLHSIVTWKKPRYSFLFLVLSLCFEFSLYLYNVGEVICVTVLISFIINIHLFKVLRSGLQRIKSFAISLFTSKQISKVTKTEVSSFTVDSSHNSFICEGKDKTDVALGEELDYSSSSDTEEDEMVDHAKKAPCESSTEQIRTTGLSKLIPRSLRRRYILSGNCYNCDHPAASIWKKRRYCRHCGNSFCSRCCQARVPRALLGATAPAAHAEKVLVCNTCHVFLSNRLKSPSELVE